MKQNNRLLFLIFTKNADIPDVLKREFVFETMGQQCFLAMAYLRMFHSDMRKRRQYHRCALASQIQMSTNLFRRAINEVEGIYVNKFFSFFQFYLCFSKQPGYFYYVMSANYEHFQCVESRVLIAS